VVTRGKAHHEILRLAAEQGAGLIVMGVQGRGAVDVMLFGSTTQYVVRAATCPVLTIRSA
jgi:nucleotide-binding universal stress UspA family protein